MKIKFIALLIISLLTTGCFNYVEINNLVIVSGISIDYKNGNYNVTFENLLQDKESSESNFASGVTKKGTGSTIAKAFDDLTLSLEKKPYFAHLKVVVISHEVANNHLDEICDFFLRNNDIRNIFSLVISSEPEEVLKQTNNYYPVASERIKNLLENNIYANYISKNKYFKNIASNFLSGEKSISLTEILKKNDELVLGDIIIFDKNRIVGKLNQEQALILSIIDNNKPSSLIQIPCDDDKDKNIVIQIYESKTKFKIKKNSFNITSNLSAEIIENSCPISLEKNKSQKKLTKDFEEEIDNKTRELIMYLQSVNSDILGVNNKYYVKYKKKNKKYFKNAKFSVKTNLKINKKGLIFEVKNDKQ